MGGFYLPVELHQEGSALQPAQQACHPLVKISLQRRHALMVEDGAFNQKTDYDPIFRRILILKGILIASLGQKLRQF